MKILTNEYGYIVSYAIKGDLKDGIEVGHLDNPFEYQYIEVNRVGVAENKATGVKNTEDIAKGNESVVLWEGSVSALGTWVTLSESFTNFKSLIIEASHDTNLYRCQLHIDVANSKRGEITSSAGLNDYGVSTLNSRWIAFVLNSDNVRVGVNKCSANSFLKRIIGVGRL